MFNRSFHFNSYLYFIILLFVKSKKLPYIPIAKARGFTANCDKLGIGKVTFLSAPLTATSLFGIGLSRNFTFLVVFSVGLGLGQGAVDSLLNTYVAKHYSSRHMTWLHGFWGVGATLGPTIMTTVLKFNFSWSSAYFSLSSLQFIISFILFLSLSYWFTSFHIRLLYCELLWRNYVRAVLIWDNLESLR